MARSKQVDLDALGADYRHAKQAVTDHLRKQSLVELERVDWLNRHRGLPPDALYDIETGDPTHPELVELYAAVEQAVADVAWCRSLVVACGEAFKGCRFEDVPNGPRPSPTDLLARVEA
ncbi:MAG: hypothetical protein ACOYXR_09315 [Nitrospirota bacterium]